MPEIPENAKRPSDRKDKQAEAGERFSFTHKGEEYIFKPTYEVLTPGWLRKNRRRDETDAFFTMVEALVDDYDDATDESPTLEVIDNMSRGQFAILMKDFYAYLEVDSAGE